MSRSFLGGFSLGILIGCLGYLLFQRSQGSNDSDGGNRGDRISSDNINGSETIKKSKSNNALSSLIEKEEGLGDLSSKQFRELLEGDLSFHGDRYSAIFSSFVKKAPSRAFSWLMNHSSAPRRKKLITKFFKEVAPLGKEQWLPYLSELANHSQLKKNAEDAALEILSIQHPEEAATYITSIPPSQRRSDLWEGHLKKIALQEPDLALKMLQEGTIDVNRHSAFAGIFQTWIEEDFSLAEAWFKKVASSSPHDEDLNNAWNSILTKEYPKLASKVVEKELSKSEESHYLSEVAANWAKDDPEAASIWADNLSEEYPHVRLQAAEAIGAEWMLRDPRKAMDWALKAFEEVELSEKENYEGENQGILTGFLSSVTQRWANEAPSEMAAWILENDQDDLTASVAGDLISSWIYSDSSAAQDWAKSLPEGIVRNAVERELSPSQPY